MLEGATVLVTGGAGSVGRKLVPRLLSQDPGTLRVFDNNEANLSELAGRIDDNRLRFLAGDVRDKERLERAMNGVDVVVHMAAMKHVNLCEYNPFEAVKTNTLGIQNIIDVAIDAEVNQVLFTSSDKAVNPANTMGATKLLAEKLLIAGNKYSGGHDISLSTVRFGNIINSSRSVVPLFEGQIREGGPVTLTDPRMVRFFLTFDDVEDLILSALEEMKGGETFLKKMPALRIEDLASVMIDLVAPEYGHDPMDIDIEVTGRRIGETFHEEVMSERECERTVEQGSLYAILPETGTAEKFINHDGLDGFSKADSIVRTTASANILSVEDIERLLLEHSALEDHR